jgi:hypothetical protein
MLKIEFSNAQHLKLMLQVAIHASATDPERASLYGVCFEVRGPLVWATASDGHWAARVRHKPEETNHVDPGFRFRIPFDDCKAVLGLIGGCEHPAQLVRDDRMAKLEVNHRGHLEWHWVAEIASPDVFEVWPEESATTEYMAQIGLSHTLLAKIGKAFSQAANDTVPLKFAFHGAESPISVTAQTADPLDVDACVMPCRLDEDGQDEDPRQTKLFVEDVKNVQATLNELVTSGATVTVQVPGQKPVKLRGGKKGGKA